MLIARDEKILKRRVEDYLWRDRSKTVSELRDLLNKTFGDFEKFSILGGMIRDIALNGKRGFRSDVDIVIDAPEEQIRELANTLKAEPNLFGGFAHISSRWKIDFWALKTTWAHRHGHIEANSIDDLIEGTFFDWDAVHYDIKNRQLYSQEGYLDKIRSRTLGVNLIDTPNAVGNAVRAVRRILIWDLRASQSLLEFLDKVVRDEGIEALTRYEKRKHRISICELYPERNSLFRALATSGDIKTLSQLGSPRQLQLPGLSDAPGLTESLRDFC